MMDGWKSLVLALLACVFLSSSDDLASMRRSPRSCHHLPPPPPGSTPSRLYAVHTSSGRMDDACLSAAWTGSWSMAFLFLCENRAANRLKVLGGKEPSQFGPSRAAWGRSRLPGVLTGNASDWLGLAHGPWGLGCGSRGNLGADGPLRVAGGGCWVAAGSAGCLHATLASGEASPAAH